MHMFLRFSHQNQLMLDILYPLCHNSWIVNAKSGEQLFYGVPSCRNQWDSCSQEFREIRMWLNQCTYVI